MDRIAGRTEYGAQGGKIGTKLLFFMVIIQIMGFALFLGVNGVQAKTFTVTSTLDEAELPDTLGDGICRTASGVCTLRAAIQEANALAGSDTIILNKGLYLLTLAGRGENDAVTGDLDIRANLTIKGKGAKKPT